MAQVIESQTSKCKALNSNSISHTHTHTHTYTYIYRDTYIKFIVKLQIFTNVPCELPAHNMLPFID
jgi:hypothetical protein